MAVNGTLRLWGDWVKLRATVGPMLMEPGVQGWVLPTWAVPNVELAVGLSPTSELTLLGGGFLGWRGRF